jgi:hypothetical protein
MTRETLYQYNGREQRILDLMSRICDLSWDDDKNAIICNKVEDENLQVLRWEEYQYVDITPIEYDGDKIDGVLLFGDGTIEFHYASCMEAINYADFPFEIMDKVIENLIKEL